MMSLPVNRSRRDPRLVSSAGVPQGEDSGLEDTQSFSFGPRNLETPSLHIWLPVQAESRALAVNEETLPEKGKAMGTAQASVCPWEITK